MEIDYTSIGLRLAQARKKANLTQADMSNLTGVGTGYISKVELGKKPSLEYLIMFSKATNTSLDNLLIGIDNRYSDNDVLKIVNLFLSIPETARPYALIAFEEMIKSATKNTPDNTNTKNVSSTSTSGVASDVKNTRNVI